ncbi:VIT family protein [Aeromicrobium sp. 636]|uniref:VIT family protein n=1 Tax=Aeromicrobium senzhongii TaxID=2663859 RepID=A0A8I0EWH8_9ACTN|nr:MULTISPECIES: VIT family protein [Aeromicrobium]MBC9226618.1 VIT family protein [Aeromicrobium senzhongii]MCQ3998719.1 VIT family protein [Aeromicrobium sp. 636]
MSVDEPHVSFTSQKLNRLRAGVLGANDGIVSVASLVVGVAGATSDTGAIATAGTAALVGGAVSMALGEYVSVSSQRDSERHMIGLESRELREDPEGELEELTQMLQERGIAEATARQAAREMTEHDALAAHLEVELGIDADDLISPWSAAFSSAVAFTAGGLLPLVAMLATGLDARLAVTFATVLVALALTGTISARIGGGDRSRAAVRLVVGGALALALTYLIGRLLGSSGMV